YVISICTLTWSSEGIEMVLPVRIVSVAISTSCQLREKPPSAIKKLPVNTDSVCRLWPASVSSIEWLERDRKLLGGRIATEEFCEMRVAIASARGSPK